MCGSASVERGGHLSDRQERRPQQPGHQQRAEDSFSATNSTHDEAG
jgi:hypothetical protein